LFAENGLIQISNKQKNYPLSREAGEGEEKFFFATCSELP
jgi:hypothetical protein